MGSVSRRSGTRSPTSLSKAVLGLYAGFVLACFCILVRHGLRLSNEYASVAPGLRPGWIGARLVDLSDVQWREFRGSMPAMALVFGFFAGVSRIWCRDGNGRIPRVAWMVGCGVVFLVYLHGRCALYVWGLVTLNWWLTRWLVGLDASVVPSVVKTVAVWVFNIAVLMVVKGTDGLGMLDRVGGLFGVGTRGVFRWEICYNMTMLRMISQSLDVLWDDRKDGGDEHGGLLGSYWTAVAHALYPPLYLAGPIMTYKDFAGQLVGSRTSRSVEADAAKRDGRTTRKTGPSSVAVATYALRVAGDLLVIELMGHYLYFNSIATNNLLTKRAIRVVEPLDVATCGWWVLAFTWLKFTVIWRFFRLAALLEGIDPPENMRKCFAMNYDVQGFWKNWHASYNRWLVKYMYIPAGGSRYQLLMVWPIFIFVALWHDIEIRLLGWAALMILAFMPELVVKREFANPRWDWVRARHGTALGLAKGLAATATISSLMVGNMVGFVVGMDGVGAFLTQLLGSPGLVAMALASFFSAAQLMFAFEPWLYG